jgi:hypothetical protein
MTDAPDGRLVFHWRGTADREADIDRLADAIATAVPGLCNRDGTVARLDEGGNLCPINLAAFRDLIGESICGARVVPNGTTSWKTELYTFEFPLTVRRGPPTNATGLVVDSRTSGPDEQVLRQIYLELLPQRLPKVVE